MPREANLEVVDLRVCLLVQTLELRRPTHELVLILEFLHFGVDSHLFDSILLHFDDSIDVPRDVGLQSFALWLWQRKMASQGQFAENKLLSRPTRLTFNCE